VLAGNNVELPALYNAANAASSDGQTRYLVLRGGQLASLIIAALAGAVTIRVGSADLAGIVVVAGFLSALGCAYLLGNEAPQEAWYDGRAAAESVKDLAWRYAMQAEPFLTSPDADGALVGQLSDTLAEVRGIALPAGGPEQITGWMRQTRALDLEGRRAVYSRDRLDDQHRWYSRKADENRSSAGRWRVTVNVLAILGVVGGALKALAIVDLDILGLVATTVGAATAWLETKQHQTLAVAYGITAQELAAARSLVGGPTDDRGWSEFVNNAENAISREHTLWRASRTVRRPGRYR
jgi:hypothetical protein